MKKNYDLLKRSLLYFVFVFIFAACEDNNTPEKRVVPTGSHGVFILFEGLATNTAGISYYNFESAQKEEEPTHDILHGKLGDLGQDMIAYGSKLYVSVTNSGIVTVLDINTKELLKRIDIVENESATKSSPRFLASYGEKVYATTQEGSVVRIDTTLLTVDGSTKVGSYPEGIAAVNGKLYVANSNGWNYPNYDKTVSIVDIDRFTEDEKIETGLNPYYLKADKYGNVYLTYQGNYEDNQGGIQRINTATKKVENLPFTANRKFVIIDDLLYFYGITLDENWISNATFGVYNIKTNQLTSSIIHDETKIESAYGIGVNPSNNDVYIANWSWPEEGSTIYVFGTDGKQKNKFSVGTGANQFVFD